MYSERSITKSEYLQVTKNFVTNFADEVDTFTKKTQSDRRLLSPVLNQIPWTTDVMRVLEDLDPDQENSVRFTMCCHPAKILINT